MLGLLFIALFLSAILASGCASVKNGWSGTKEHAPLIEQIVRVRKGYRGLTHQTCVEFDWWGKCSKMTVIEYDMMDAAVRERFVQNAFICQFGGRRYKIDPELPQIVRYQRSRNCWLFCPEVTEKVEPVPFVEVQKLLDGALTCYSERTYPSGIH